MRCGAVLSGGFGMVMEGEGICAVCGYVWWIDGKEKNWMGNFGDMGEGPEGWDRQRMGLSGKEHVADGLVAGG